MVGSSNAVVALIVCVATLAANLSGGYVEAKDGCFKGVKNLFRSKKPTVSPWAGPSVAPEPQVPYAYESLADYVHGATSSEEFADITRQAALMLDKHSRTDQVKLVMAFSQLKALTDDKDSLCGAENLANLRLVTKAVGDAASKQATDAILRLNKIIVRYIAETSSVCFAHLEGKWPDLWEPNFKLADGKLWISQLSLLPNSYLYEGYMTDRSSPLYSRFSFGTRMSTVLYTDDKLAQNPVHKTYAYLPDRDNADTLTMQVREQVHKPCREFLKLTESKTVLCPYNDLLISWYIVTEGPLKEFYQSQGLSPSVPTIPFEGKINLVFSHRACTLLLAESANRLGILVADTRRKAYQSG